MRAIVLGTLIAAAVGFGFDATAPVAAVGQLTLTVPPHITAGETADATITAGAPDGTVISVVVIDSLGTSGLQARLNGGRAQVTLPVRARHTAGLVTVIAAAGTVSATASMEVAAGPVVDPLVPLLGARSIVADGRDQAMVVGIPEDSFGNPQPDGTRLSVSIRRHTGVQAAWAAEVAGGVAWTWIPSDTRAGTTLVALASGTARGPAAYLQEVPDLPVAITLSADRTSVPADGRALVAIETGELLDANGNRLLDGTAVSLSIIEPGGKRSVVPATVTGGRASALLEAPRVPGAFAITASVGTTASRPLIIEFTPMVATDIPALTTFGAEAVTVVVGPVLGVEAAYVPDGTVVRGTGAAGEAICHTTGGLCTLELPANFEGALRLEAAGSATVIEIGKRS